MNMDGELMTGKEEYDSKQSEMAMI